MHCWQVTSAFTMVMLVDSVVEMFPHPQSGRLLAQFSKTSQ